MLARLRPLRCRRGEDESWGIVNTIARAGRLRRAIFRVVPFASLAGLSALTAVDGTYFLAVCSASGTSLASVSS